MARAKQTGRAEARRRYRQSMAPTGIDGEDQDIEEAADTEPERAAPKAAPARSTGERPPSGRLGFGEAFRRAYHPPQLREDLRTLPTTARSLGFIAAILMVIAGGAIWYAYPVYSGSLTAWQLLVLPGSALAPQLVAGFFAPRASYLLGLLVGLLQPIVYLVVDSSPPVREAYLARGVNVPGITVDQAALAFLNSVVMGGLFAAMAAWYRRFLALSSGRPSSRSSASGAGRAASKAATRRTATR